MCENLLPQNLFEDLSTTAPSTEAPPGFSPPRFVNGQHLNSSRRKSDPPPGFTPPRKLSSSLRRRQSDPPPGFTPQKEENEAELVRRRFTSTKFFGTGNFFSEKDYAGGEPIGGDDDDDDEGEIVE